tara:strand:- start:145 stop:897 length:753 start_codon:yes stop_codon:yes gene_type:complete
MKIAVCISGQCASKNKLTNLKRNRDRLKSKFPGADFFYATYNSFQPAFEKAFPNEKCLFIEEPNMHYHPYVDIDAADYFTPLYGLRKEWAKGLSPEKFNWTSHHTKQILIHSWLLEDMKKEGHDYDVIVRARFDTFIHKNAEPMKYVKDAYDTGIVHGFGVTKWQKFHEFYDSPMTGKHEVYMLDQMIIHRKDRINTKNIQKLHEEKKLHAAEWGWYQVLSHPYGGVHMNHHGFVNPDWSVRDEYLLDLK